METYSSSRRLWSAVCDKVFGCTEQSADRSSSSAVPSQMGLTSWACRRCGLGADNLQQVDSMCLVRAVVGYSSLLTTLWSLCGNTLWRLVASLQITELSSYFPQISCSLLQQNYREAPVAQKHCAPGECQSSWHKHKAKWMESALAFLQRYHDDGDEFLVRITTGDETWVAHNTAEYKQKCVCQCQPTALVRASGSTQGG